MLDRSARATGIRWTEPGLRMPMALLALSVGLKALKCRGGSFSGDAMACGNSAEPVEQQRSRHADKSIRCGDPGDLVAGGWMLFRRHVDVALRLCRAGFSGRAVVARLRALLVMMATLVASLNNGPNRWSEGFRRLLFVLSLTWVPAIDAVRHPSRSMRVAFPCHPVSHVQ